MNVEHTRVGWDFWRAWVLASCAGFVLGTYFGGGVAYSLFDWDNTLAIGLTYGLILGAIGGVLQWAVLREKVARSGWWVLAHALGLSLALGAPGVIGGYASYFWATLLIASVCGILTGIIQWLVLRPYGIQAWWWLLVSLVGALVASLGVPISAAIGWTVNYLQAALAFGLCFGVGLGAIPGFALVLALRQPQDRHSAGPATVH